MIDDILQERTARYGDFVAEARIVEQLKALINASKQPWEFDAVHAHALDMICVKLARIVNGDPDYADNWQDIIGYCTLVLRFLEETEK